MSIFFTPVEVKRSSPKSQNPYQYYKYNDDPFKMTQFSVQSITDQKRKIVNWLKKLSPLQKFDRLTFTNKQFVCLILQMYKRRQQFSNEIIHFSIYQNEAKQFNIKQKIIQSEVRPYIENAQQELINAIIIMNKYTRFDSISICQTMADNIDRLFQLFQIIQDGISHELTQQQYHRDFKKYDFKNSESIFYRPKQTQQYAKSIGLWIVQTLKKNISIQFFRNKEKQGSLDSLRRQESQLQSQFSSKQYAQNFRKVWKMMVQQDKKQLLTKIFQNKIINLMFQYRQIVRVSNQCYPTVYQTDFYEVNQKIQKLVNCDPKDLFFMVAFSTIKQSHDSYSYYKYQIILAIEQKIKKIVQFSSEKLPKRKSIPRTQSLKEQITVQIQTNDQVSFTKKIPIEHHTQNFKIEKNSFYKSKQKSCTYEEVDCITTNQDSEQKSIVVHQKKKKKRNKIRTMTPKQQQCSDSDKILDNKSERGFVLSCQTTTLNENQTSESQLSKIQSKIKERKAFSPRTEKHSESYELESNSTKKKQKMEKEADKTYEQCLTKIVFDANLPNKYRKIVTNRIGLVLSHLNLSYKLYGSFACGLALATSDVDISVDPTIVHYFYAQFCSYRQKIVKSLQFLKGILKPMKWISDINVIPGASIPLLTFIANPLEPYEASPTDSRLNILRTKNKGMAQINVDVTVDSFVNMTHQIAPHLGFEATILMKEWLGVFPELTNIVLFMKQILFTHSLNKPYTGGLGSFAMMTAIFAHLKMTKPDRNSSSLQKMTDILRFFYEFDQKTWIIDLRREKDPIFKKVDKSNKLIIVSPLNGSNMTQTCFQFLKIKQVCKQVNKLIEIIQQENQKGGKNDKNSFMKLVFGG